MRRELLDGLAYLFGRCSSARSVVLSRRCRSCCPLIPHLGEMPTDPSTTRWL